MTKRRLWIALALGLVLLMVSAVPADAGGRKGDHRRFGGEQVMALNIDLETNANLYGCDEISWFGTIDLYGRTYGMALYPISSNVGDDGLIYYEEGWRIFTGKFRVEDGEIRRCHPGRVLAAGTDTGVWDISTGEFESVGSVEQARGRLRRWDGKSVTQDGVAPQPVTVAGLEGVPGLIGKLQLEPSHGCGWHPCKDR